MYDLADICTGKAIYGMDAHMDGMVYASIEHPPVLEHNIGVIVYSPMASGRNLQPVETLRVIGRRHDATPGEKL